MDKKYLNHIAASPYIDEGVFDKVGASVSGVGQRFKNTFPSENPYQSPRESKLLYYYNSFINDIKNILSEFSFGPASPAERLKKSDLTPSQLNIVNTLTGLHDTFFPSVFPSGTRPNIRGALTKSGTLNPKNKSYAQSMAHLVTESWLNRLGTKSGGIVNSIINKYVNDINNIYDTFLKNIKNLIPASTTTAPITPTTIFKNNIRDKNVVKNVNKIETALDYIRDQLNTRPKAPLGSVPPVLPNATTTNVPPVLPNDGNTEKNNADNLVTLVTAVMNIISSRVIEDKNSEPYFSKPYYADVNASTPDYYLPTTMDEPYPLKHGKGWSEPKLTIPQYIQDLPDDSPEKQSYIDKKNAEYNIAMSSYRYEPIYDPTKTKILGYRYKHVKDGEDIGSGTVPIPTPNVQKNPLQEVSEDEENDTASTDVSDNVPISKDFENTGEFLYDFAGLYTKQPGKYQIEVTHKPVAIDLPDGSKKIIRVFWHWVTHNNVIVLKYMDSRESDVWAQSNLFSFYDDQVNPQSPTYQSDANVYTFLKNEDPKAANLFLKADPQKIKESSEALKVFKPAIYAVVRRKGPMEFKSHKSLGFYIPPEWKGGKFDNINYGNVRLLRGTFKDFKRNQTVPFKDIKEYYFKVDLSDDAREKFLNALSEAEYWDSYTDIRNEFTKSPKSDDSEESPEPESNPAAIEKSKTPTSPTKAEPTSTTSNPSSGISWQSVENAVKAAAALKTLKYKNSSIFPVIQKIVDEIGKDKTEEEYLKLALKHLSPQPAPVIKATTPDTGSGPKTNDISEELINPYQLINFI